MSNNFEQQPYTLEQTMDRGGRIARLIEMIVSGKPEEERETGIFSSRYKRKLLTSSGEQAVLTRFENSDFSDHNYQDPQHTVEARVDQPDGSSVSMMKMNAHDDEPYLEAFYTRPLTKKDKRTRVQHRIGSILPKIGNHLITSGAFIGGVEAARQQRIENRIFNTHIQSGATRPATAQELAQLQELLDS